MSVLYLPTEPIARPCDYGLETFEELTSLIRAVLLKLYLWLPVELAKLITTFAIWEGPQLYTRIDVVWGRNRIVYKGVIIGRTGNDAFLVSYTGWPDDWDDWINVNHTSDDAVGVMFPNDHRTQLTRILVINWPRDAEPKLQLKPGAWVGWCITPDHPVLVRVIEVRKSSYVEIDTGQRRSRLASQNELFALCYTRRFWSCSGDRDVCLMESWCGVCDAASCPECRTYTQKERKTTGRS